MDCKMRAIGFSIAAIPLLAIGAGCVDSEIDPAGESDSDADSDSDTDSDSDSDSDTDTDADTDTGTGTGSDSGYDLLLLSPDYSAADTDLTDIEGIFGGYTDVSWEWWDTALGAPSAADLAAYDVVVVGNRTPWTESSASASAVGDALADYIDGGGAVIDTNYVHDYYVSTYTWYLEGRYVDEGYAPFTQASTETGDPQAATILDGDHPVMSGVTTLTENIADSLVIDPGLAAGAVLLATWSPSSYNAVAVSSDGSVVALNMCLFSASESGGDVGLLLHNAIEWLAGS